MKIRITDEILKRYPRVKIGVVVAKNLQIKKIDQERIIDLTLD